MGGSGDYLLLPLLCVLPLLPLERREEAHEITRQACVSTSFRPSSPPPRPKKGLISKKGNLSVQLKQRMEGDVILLVVSED